MKDMLAVYVVALAVSALFCGYWVYQIATQYEAPKQDSRWIVNTSDEQVNLVADCGRGVDGYMHCPATENVTNYFSNCTVAEDGAMYCEVV